MDNMEIEETPTSGSVESVVKITRKEFEGGGFEETKIEEVEGGYIKTIRKSVKKNGEWKFEEEKSVHTEDPSEEKSTLAEKLEKVINGLS